MNSNLDEISQNSISNYLIHLKLDAPLSSDGLPWPETADATVWAYKFCKHHGGTDYGTMIIWFANAIMSGYDMAKRNNGSFL